MKAKVTDATSFINIRFILCLYLPRFEVERDGTDIVSPALASSNCSMPASSNNSGNLTDFTKCKNWSKHIIAELKDPYARPQSRCQGHVLLTLSLELVGYAPEESCCAEILACRFDLAHVVCT
ncbi:hypothetical protein BC937DRAFT_86874 [Endogone sp. FLAS-F59071]|nr:hypothetical protein BC937DRAFT_86874 [Endogone sp. FLAS-F59071]|eukprot:RUS12853.1 hypothetical protein BC937DRAFT_86874 [Endogone sp. FLAS-F59071]